MSMFRTTNHTEHREAVFGWAPLCCSVASVVYKQCVVRFSTHRREVE